jgi:hypothetical protein
MMILKRLLIKLKVKYLYKFKIGDKVKIPKTKSIGDSIDHSSIIFHVKKRQINYLIIKDIVGETYILNVNDDSEGGDWFRKEDLELYFDNDFDEEINKIKKQIGIIT